MSGIVIVSAVRTPLGRFLGGLSRHKAPALGAVAIREAIKGIDAKDIDEVIMGNVLQAGLHQNPARQALMGAGLPAEKNAFTVNKVCGSGLKAVMLAAQAIKAGDAEVVVAGGFESMSNAPFLLNCFRQRQKLGDFAITPGKDPSAPFALVDRLSGRQTYGLAPQDGGIRFTDYKGNTTLEKEIPFADAMVNDGLWDCYNASHMGALAESLTASHGITREEQDLFALESHRKAVAAAEQGRFRNEIVPVDGLSADEGPRADSTLERLSSLKPVFKEGGTVTAGNASTINDGGAALVVMTREKAEDLGLAPLATIEGYASAHLRPELYMVAPSAAVRALHARTGASVADYGLIELNEAFAIQSLAVIRDLGIDQEKLNVNGGAIALGHPIGCSGARILVTLIHAMVERGKERGLATLCLGGGGAVALSLRRA